MQKIVKLVQKDFTILTPKPHRPMQIVASAIALLVLMSLEITTILVGTTPALAAPILTPSDQDQSITSFISAFYDPNNHFFYTDTQNHAEADLWTEAVDWGVIMDAYNRSKNATYNQMIGDIYNHVTSQNGANCGQWQAGNSNQTLAWWAETSLEAYAITNNTSYKDCAKGLFDKIYQSWDTTQAGGGIWTLNNQTTEKNMTTNALSTMAAAQLSTILGDSSYLTKAQSIYSWIRTHLTNLTGSSGAVYDRYDSASNTIIMNQFSDNYGTFIGAATALNDATKNNTSAANNQSVNYLADANTIANASITNVTINGDGIIQYESDCNNHTSAGDTSNSISGNNGNIVNDGNFVNSNNTCTGGTDERALYKGIYAHYLASLAFNSNYAVSQSATYGQVLDENAALAVNDRRSSDNLVGPDWAEPAPTGPIRSWEAAAAVEILQILPNNNNIATYQSQDATLQGGLSLATQSGGYFSNSGYIGSWSQDGQSVSYTASAPSAGTELLIIRYAAGAGNATRYLQVNGNQNTANIPTGPIYNPSTTNSVVSQITFPGTNSWGTYNLDVIPALLNQGNNTITISFNSSQGSGNALNLDELTVTPGFPPPPIGSLPNSTPSASSITASSVAPNTFIAGIYPGNFRYYPETCDNADFTHRENTNKENLFSSIISNDSGKGGSIDGNGKFSTYFNEGSNSGKRGNSSRDYGSSSGNYGDNVGKCGNGSPIPGQTRPADVTHTPNRDTDSHTSNRNTDSHTSNRNTDSHTSNRNTDSHTPNRNTDSHTSNRDTDSHTPNRDTDSHTSNRNTDSHTSNRNTDSHTSNRNTDSHTSNRNTDSHTSNRNTDSHTSNRNTDSHTPWWPLPTQTPSWWPIEIHTPWSTTLTHKALLTPKPTPTPTPIPREHIPTHRH